MDQTAVQEGTPPQKPTVTAIQAGPPVLGSTPAKEPERLARYVLVRLADPRLTVTLFAQVDQGVWTVVQKYFRSLLVWVPLKVVFFNCVDANLPIPYPGGWLIGGAMFINLLAAHAIRFKLSWARSGILLLHAGIIIMMLGELVTGLYAVEGNMFIRVGETADTVIETGKIEFT